MQVNNNGNDFNKVNEMAQSPYKKTPQDGNKPVILTYTPPPTSYVPSVPPGGYIPSIPFHFDNDVNDAMNLVDHLLLNEPNKNQVVNAMNDFHRIISKMDSGELVEVATNLANYVDKSDTNDSMLLSLQKSVLEKIREKNHLGPAPQPVEPPKPYAPHPNVSNEEINWAMELENKVKNGYEPNAEEVKTYQDIAKRLVESQSNPAPEPFPAATTEEIIWATNLENMVKQGYEPTPKEVERYQEIYSRVK